MRSYHIVLGDGSERDVKADDVHVAEGVLSFTNKTQLILAYAPGQWKSVEVERLDDKGE